LAAGPIINTEETEPCPFCNEPAIETAKEVVFILLFVNNAPVSMWLSVPFKFKLADKN